MARQRTALIGFIALAALAAGCATGASVAPGSAAPASAAGSQPAASPSPSPVATAEPSPSTSAAASTGQAGGEAKKYACTDLITDTELAAALGVTDLSPMIGPSEGSPGLTDCGAFRADGMYVQITVWTGEDKVGFDQLFAAAMAGTAAKSLSGIGDEAAYGITDDGATGGAAVGPVGISVVFLGSVAGIDVEAAMRQILTLVADRV